MDDFTAESIKMGLRKMFAPDHWFDISAVRTCLDTADIPRPPALKELEPLHCVRWGAMAPGFRAEVVRRTLALFDNPAFTVEDVAPNLALDSPGFITRMLGKGKDA